MIKRIISVIICFVITLFVYIFQDVIIDNTFRLFNNFRKIEISETTNQYTKGYNYEFVSIDDDFVPYNYQDLLNIFYTALDKRYSSVTFYCPRAYEECFDDVDKLRSENNEEILTIVGNLVSPYNNYTNVSVYYDTTGKVVFGINYLYDDDMIRYVNEEIDKVFEEHINDNMTQREKITALHDYIVKNTEYDVQYDDELKLYGKTTYPSNTAYGLFKYHYAICSGYTDLMALFLDRLGIYNFKIASETHIWNIIKNDEGYLHIDTTWDDPVNNYLGIRYYDYLLITSDKLKELDVEKKKHIYDESIYLELK